MDSHYEAAEQKAAAQFARIVQEWGSKCNHPAPFNIMSMPYWALYYSYYRVFQWCSTGCPSRPPERLYDEQDDKGRVSEVYATSGWRARRWRARSGDGGGQPTLGHLSYNAALKELKDQIAGQLQIQFGDYEDNGTLIDKAVKVLNRRMEEKIDKMAQEKITKIEEKIDNMAQEYKGVSHRLEELIKLMAQKPTGTSASAREE